MGDEGEIDTNNVFLVGSRVDGVILIHSMPALAKGLSDEDALNLAAYLVAVTGVPFERFQKVYEAICNT